LHWLTHVNTTYIKNSLITGGNYSFTLPVSRKLEILHMSTCNSQSVCFRQMTNAHLISLTLVLYISH